MPSTRALVASVVESATISIADGSTAASDTAASIARPIPITSSSCVMDDFAGDDLPGALVVRQHRCTSRSALRGSAARSSRHVCRRNNDAAHHRGSQL